MERRRPVDFFLTSDHGHAEHIGWQLFDRAFSVSLGMRGLDRRTFSEPIKPERFPSGFWFSRARVEIA